MRLHIKEKDVLATCIQWLELHRVMFIRTNAVKLVTRNGQTFPTPMRDSQKGIADLILILPDPRGYVRAVACECKSSIGKLSKDQQRWKETWTAAGGVYMLVRSIEDLQMLNIKADS